MRRTRAARLSAGCHIFTRRCSPYGHPSGLAVTVIDGDRISAANCVRQPFSASEIGLFKSVVLINRLNLFWGLDWQAVPQHLATWATICTMISIW